MQTTSKVPNKKQWTPPAVTATRSAATAEAGALALIEALQALGNLS